MSKLQGRASRGRRGATVFLLGWLGATLGFGFVRERFLLEPGGMIIQLVFGAVLFLFSGVASLGAETVAAVPGQKESQWEPEIRRFEEADAANPPEPGGIVFVGSSSIRLWKTLTDDFPGLRVVGRGFGGSRIKDSTRFAPRIVFPYKPAMVVIYAGDNDIAAGVSPAQVCEDFKEFVRTVRRELPRARVGFIAIKPSLARWHLIAGIREANKCIGEFAASEKEVVFLDVFTPMLGSDGKPRAELLADDGLHLSGEGYAVWAACIRPHLVSSQK